MFLGCMMIFTRPDITTIFYHSTDTALYTCSYMIIKRREVKTEIRVLKDTYGSGDNHHLKAMVIINTH